MSRQRAFCINKPQPQKPMRIGLLTTSYPRHPHDLAGRFVADLAAWLAGAGHELEVLAPHPAGPDPHPGVSVRALRHTVGPTRLLYGAGAPDNLRNPLAMAEVPLFVARLSAECLRRRGRWTHVMSHWLAPCGLVAASAARGLPHLAVAHSSDITLLTRLPAGAHLLARLARSRASLVLTSEALRTRLEPLARGAEARRFVETAAVVRMGIWAPTPESESPPFRVPRSELRVLFLGRLVEVKGVDLLIQACAPLPGVTLTIAGDGPERRALERLVVQAGAARRVRFVGQQLGPDKEALLREVDALALPSRVLPDGRTDSAPVVLLEAMAAGLPVVATRVGGNEELISHEHNGLLVPPHQIGPLRDCLERLRDDAALRASLCLAGRRTAAEFTWDRVGPKLERMLAEL